MTEQLLELIDNLPIKQKIRLQIELNIPVKKEDILQLLEEKECNNSECDRCGGEVGASSTICFNCGKREYY